MPDFSSTWVIVPTYWTWPSSDPRSERVTGAFDHPTPVDGESTLPRLLESLSEQDGLPFQVLVLAGYVEASPDLIRAARDRLTDIFKAYASRLSLYLCDAETLSTFRREVDRAGVSLPERAFDLISYAGIRNLQLLIPHIGEAEVIIALDDDEVVPSDYVARARDLVGRRVGHSRVLGLAGPYADAAGNIYLPEPEATGNIFHDKPIIMNEGLRALMQQPGELVPSPQALGGNMAFHRELFMRVGFDPGITRGEDMDYLINARLAGVQWWMAKDLRITHLPPHHYRTPRYDQLRKDLIRFFYERAKLRSHGVDPALFDPYPGRFLRADLEQHALEALESEATPAYVRLYGDPETILAEAAARAETHLPRYAGFATGWEALMRRIAEDTTLRHTLQITLLAENNV
ncbi:MAG TPA: hypothetical protein ENI95_14645 [Chloroflexi bacterium]|nr:hypothetical protein [Chloroflexota bacterium]